MFRWTIPRVAPQQICRDPCREDAQAQLASLAREYRLGRRTSCVGKRISLKSTRAIIDAIHSGALANAKRERDPVFGFDIITEVPGVPAEILRPRDSWADKAAYDATAKKLAGLFNKNFETYAAGASDEVLAAAPKV